jgi:hypothetical protein
MSYSRSTTIDSGPTGDTVVQAVLDLDTDLTAIYTDLNTHEALTTGAHGITAGEGYIVGTDALQTLTRKTISAPTITGAVTGSGMTLTGGTISGATLTGATTGSGMTLTGGTISAATITSGTATNVALTGGSSTNMTITTPTITGGTSTNLNMTTPNIGVASGTSLALTGAFGMGGHAAMTPAAHLADPGDLPTALIWAADVNTLLIRFGLMAAS